MTPILIRDRETKEIREEKPPAEQALVWLYRDSLVSKVVCFFLAHFTFLGWGYALFQKSPFSKKTIQPFVQKYGLDTSEFDPIETFKSFAHFFERRLHPNARPVDQNSNALVSPADGRLKEVGVEKPFDVKGRPFTIEKLVRDPSIAQRFEKGKVVTVRLAPDDYHRLHAPLDGKVVSVKNVWGPLRSVSPIALRQKLSILSENKRKIIDFGDYALVLVGATFIGTIHVDLKAGDEVKKGEEIGHFSFGGSMCVLLMKEGFELTEDLYFPEGEVRVKMGQPIALRV
ncbi:MAG: phosphatidylserine decarboxylase [Chlamydiae bacterium]|nr:phosphatidylserine decarboxylase [Chlamydiota bacterium]